MQKLTHTRGSLVLDDCQILQQKQFHLIMSLKGDTLKKNAKYCLATNLYFNSICIMDIEFEIACLWKLDMKVTPETKFKTTLHTETIKDFF